MKIYWLSTQDLSAAQRAAIQAIHGKNVEIVWDSKVGAVASFIQCYKDDVVYVDVACHPVSAIESALTGCRFGVICPNGSFLYVNNGKLTTTWDD